MAKTGDNQPEGIQTKSTASQARQLPGTDKDDPKCGRHRRVWLWECWSRKQIPKLARTFGCAWTSLKDTATPLIIIYFVSEMESSSV